MILIDGESLEGDSALLKPGPWKVALSKEFCILDSCLDSFDFNRLMEDSLEFPNS